MKKGLQRLVGMLLVVGAIAGASGVVRAHGIGLGLLALDEAQPGRFAVLWKTDRPQDRVAPSFPSECRVLPQGIDLAGGGPHRFSLACGDRGSSAVAVTFASALGRTANVLVRVRWRDGAEASQMSRLSTPVTLARAAQPTAGATLVRYLGLGVEHILGGIDHLLFVFGLLLLAGHWRPLVAAVTAFTVAHSLTLVVAATDLVRVPAPPVEVVIALSILYLAAEIARRSTWGEPRLLAAAAFAFGLLHGLGFAGALMEVGVPPGQLVSALFGFNVGVELGQLFFVAAVGLPLLLLLRWRPLWAARTRRASAYGMGIVAATWTFQRLATMFV